MLGFEGWVEYSSSSIQWQTSQSRINLKSSNWMKYALVNQEGWHCLRRGSELVVSELLASQEELEAFRWKDWSSKVQVTQPLTLRLARRDNTWRSACTHHDLSAWTLAEQPWLPHLIKMRFCVSDGLTCPRGRIASKGVRHWFGSPAHQPRRAETLADCCALDLQQNNPVTNKSRSSTIQTRYQGICVVDSA